MVGHCMQLGKTWHGKLTRHSRQGGRADRLQNKTGKTDYPAVRQVSRLVVKTDR